MASQCLPPMGNKVRNEMVLPRRLAARIEPGGKLDIRNVAVITHLVYTPNTIAGA